MSKDISGHINNLIEADPKADIVKVQKITFTVYTVVHVVILVAYKYIRF